MLHLDPGHLLKQLAGQMRLLPVPGDASVSLPGCAFARRHDRLAGGLAVVQDAMTMLEIPSDYCILGRKFPTQWPPRHTVIE